VVQKIGQYLILVALCSVTEEVWTKKLKRKYVHIPVCGQPVPVLHRRVDGSEGKQ
jgi:hypothetical protein